MPQQKSPVFPDLAASVSGIQSLKVRGCFLITGAASGIGRDLAVTLAAEPYSVERIALLDTNTNKNKSVRDECLDINPKGDFMCFSPVDVSNPEELAQAFQSARRHFKTIAAVVNSAGIVTRDFLTSIMEGPDMGEGLFKPKWRKEVDVNLTGLMHATQLGLQWMKHQGGPKGGEAKVETGEARTDDRSPVVTPVVVNVSSLAAYKSDETQAIYGGDEAGVVGFTRALAQLFTAASPDGKQTAAGMRVMALCPEFTETPMLTQSVPKALTTLLPKSSGGPGTMLKVREVTNGILHLIGADTERSGAVVAMMTSGMVAEFGKMRLAKVLVEGRGRHKRDGAGGQPKSKL